MTRQISKSVKRIVTLTLAVMLIASAMFVPSVVSAATKEEYEALGIHPTGALDLTDYNSGAAVDEGITSDSMSLTGANKTVSYDVYSDIATLSYDIKVNSDATSGNVYFPRINYWGNSGVQFMIENGTFKALLLSNSTSGAYVNHKTNATYTDYLNKWLTVTIEYAAANDSSHVNANNYKFLNSIKLVDENTTSLYKLTPTKTTRGTQTDYGVNVTTETEPDTTTIGFTSNSKTLPTVEIKNLEVTYRDNATKVIGYIDAIGDVTATAECLANIEKAEKAYALLTDAEKTNVTNYTTLTTARETYDNLIENAGVEEVINKIAAIGTVDVSDGCLAKIVAAEEAYAALSAEKQAKVTNYTTLVKARSAYNAAKYGIHPTGALDLTDYNSGAAVDEGITSDSMSLTGANKTVSYDVYSDIATLSYDIKVNSDATSGNVYFPRINYWGNSGVQFMIEGGTFKALLLSNSTSGAYMNHKANATYTDYLNKWLTVTIEYAAANDSSHVNANNYKFLNSIKLVDENTTSLYKLTPTKTTRGTQTDYGVNVTTETEPDTTTIGFTSNSKTLPTVEIKNLKVTYENTAVKEKINAIDDIVIDNSASTVAQVEDIAETYALLPEEMKSAELTSKINAAAAAVEVAASAEAPVVKGATIHATDDITNQNMRFSTVMPTQAPDGYSIVEYGTVMFPTQLIDEGEELKLGIVDGNNKAGVGKTTVTEGEAIPLAWDSVLIGIDFKADANNACGIRISARSYVKYSDGENEIIVYSKNTDNYEEAKPTQGVNKGVCNRSVYSIAKNIAAAVVDTTTYPVGSCGEIVGEIDLATAGNAEILTFVYNNQARVAAIAAAKAAN